VGLSRGALRCNPWLGALLLTILLGLVLSACGAAASVARPRTRAPAVAAGVRLAGVEVGGMDGPAALRVAEGLAGSLARAPRNAYVDPSTHGLVPGVDGVEVDVPATVRALLQARPGADVAPVLRPVAPAVALRDLPAAPIYNGPPGRRAVALLINVAWGEQYVPEMLRVLEAERAPATWCLVGRWAETHPEVVAAIVAAGREDPAGFTYCNHGYRDHGWALLSEGQALESIRGADAVIERLTGEKPLYFSPHRGEYNPGVLAAARASGHELVLWSLDTIDWKHPTPSTIRRRIVGRVKPGDIILMHPTAETQAALAGLIAGIRAKDLRLATLDQLLNPAWRPGDPAGGQG
jgi:peptidoglycan/xylan/chitin deacetylase (PgdA/CDA1 family)